MFIPHITLIGTKAPDFADSNLHLSSICHYSVESGKTRMNVSTTNREKNLHHRSSKNRERLISEVRAKLVKYYKPEKVILFGSQAYGRPKRDSDLDLLIIKRTRKDFFERIREVSGLFPLRDFALDVIVRTPSELRTRLAWGDFFYKEIVTRGRILYEKQ